MPDRHLERKNITAGMSSIITIKTHGVNSKKANTKNKPIDILRSRHALPHRLIHWRIFNVTDVLFGRGC